MPTPTLGLITSSTNGLKSQLKDLGILHYFKDVYSSCDYLLRKPNKMYFNVVKKPLLKRYNNVSSLDIWYIGNDYHFDVGAVKLKRKVIAPYKVNGKPKDWDETADGNFRLTYPGNFWDDISIPFWSMPENTDHPTQKPEKLYAKLILASSKEGDVVFDPFLGSGTASVVAKKLNRNYCGIEMNKEYCLLAEKRLEMADFDKSIQGYADGVFWERNSGK